MKNGVTVAILAALTSLCLVHAADPDEKEVIFEGKALRKWLEEQVDPESSVRRDDADDALRRFCDNPDRAVPALTAALGDKKEAVRGAAATCLGYYCKSAAGSVIPPLLKTLRADESSSVRVAAAEALAVAGPQNDAVRAALLRALKEDKVARVRATIILQFRHIESVTVLPALTDALKDRDAEVRIQAGYAVGELAEPKSAIPLLVDALKDPDESVRWAAAVAVGRLCPEAVPALCKALRDENPAVRAVAVKALGAAPEEARPLMRKELPAITPLLDDKDSEVRVQAAFTLRRIDPVAAVPALVAKLEDAAARVRLECIGGLGYIGPDAAAAVEQLIIRLKKDPDPALRCAAARSLRDIAPKAKAVVSALSEALEDEDVDVRCRAAYILGDIGPDARAAVPKLKEASKSDNKTLQRYAEVALKKIGG
jgi:HEAT repeat protein